MSYVEFCNITEKEQMEICKMICDYAEKAYNKGYNEGYTDAHKKHNSDLDYKDGLEDGRMEAWECAKKIYKMSAVDLGNIFGGISLWTEYSASEAIAKIKEYEDKQTDDVNITALKAVCEELSDARGSDFSGVIALENAIKVLEQMKGEQND
jgi:hypothetical protein